MKFGRNLAIVGQDNLRRIVLRQLPTLRGPDRFLLAALASARGRTYRHGRWSWSRPPPRCPEPRSAPTACGNGATASAGPTGHQRDGLQDPDRSLVTQLPRRPTGDVHPNGLRPTCSSFGVGPGGVAGETHLLHRELGRRRPVSTTTVAMPRHLICRFLFMPGSPLQGITGRPSGHSGNIRYGRHGCIDRGTGSVRAGNTETTRSSAPQDPGPRIAVRPPRTRTKTYFCRRTFS